ncbi:MAG TPA: Killer protein [Parvularcula sp.]|nr:Killer protein [Parvularcula sp.]
MIKTLKGRIAEAVAAGRRPKGFPPDLIGRAENRLAMIDAAVRLDDLRSPPGNRLEALKGDRKGAWSIRINDQWRVCFDWDADGARDVEIVDYHD